MAESSGFVPIFGFAPVFRKNGNCENDSLQECQGDGPPKARY